MDEGLPISYAVLDQGVAVLAADGTEVGLVAQVLAARDLDIFHGIVVASGAEQRSVGAEHIASLHERGVDLRLGAQEFSALTATRTSQPEPAAHPGFWKQLVDTLERKDPSTGS